MIVYRPTHSLNVRYCLPNKLFEYMMAGVPTLSSSLDAIAEILTTYDTGRVVASLEPEAVADAINAILADADTLARMRENGWRAAREEFRWDVEQERLLLSTNRSYFHDKAPLARGVLSHDNPPRRVSSIICVTVSCE